MFAVVSFEDEPKGVSERLKRKFGKNQVTAEKITVAPGVFYFSLSSNFTARKADWDMIFNTAGSFKNRLILPEGVYFPKDLGYRPCRCESLKKRVFIASVYDVLKNESCKAITLDDDGGAFAEDIFRFVPLAPVIRVLTDSPEIYESIGEEIMEKYGASLIVCPRNTRFSHTKLISYGGGAYIGEGIEAFTAADNLFGASRLIRLKGLSFSEEILSLVPNDIKAETFISALCEYSHFTLPENAVFPLWEGLGA